MGNPFVHVELNTSDVDKAKKFYGQLFAWQFEDVAMGPSGHYTMIKPGEGTGGGMLKHPMPGEPSTWLAYVVGGGRGCCDREGEEARGQDRAGRDRGAGSGMAEHHHGSDGSHSRTVETQDGRLGTRAATLIV